MGNSVASENSSAGLEKKKRNELLRKQEATILREETDDEDEETVDTTDRAKHEANLATLKSRLQASGEAIDPIDLAAFEVNPSEFKYPFENLAFEGGGSKGLAYVGAVQCLEECGVIPQIRRVAGTSAGAITATLIAVGYNWEEIYDCTSGNTEAIFVDHSCGFFSLLPNLIRRFGWNPLNVFHRWFGNKIKAKSAAGNPDMTFYDLYRERNVELCVVVTNLNCMSAEYCHPKTTPDMPIRDALRMTIAIPGMYAATRYDNHGQEDTYVDGGVLCNYPVHCFDGWFLSMEHQDSFLLRCNPLKDLSKIMCPSNRFSPKVENKTVGFLLYDNSETEIMRYNLEKRIGSLLPDKPDKETKLFKEKTKKKRRIEKCEKEHAMTVEAVEKFLEVLHKNNTSETTFINKDELEAALEDEDFPVEQKDRLFGKDCDLDSAFKILDQDGNNKIAFFELISFIEEHGIRMQKRFQGYGRRDIDSFPHFLDALQETLLTNLKYVFVGEGDEDRTVGINTGHVTTSDLKLEEADREFVRKRGYNATHAYLRYFVARNPQAVTKKEKAEVTPEDQPGEADVAKVAESNGPAKSSVQPQSSDTQKLLENNS